MITPATGFEPIRAFLYQDPFANASLISLIERRLPELTDVWTLAGDRGRVAGVLALSASGEIHHHVSLEAESPEAVYSLLKWLPPGEEYQFALHREWHAALLERQFYARHESTMEVYRCLPTTFCPQDDPSARALTRADARAVRRAHDAHFDLAYEDHLGGRPTEDGQLIHTFGLLLGDRLASRCVTSWSAMGIEREIGTVWSVVTLSPLRNRGYGRSVVSAATRAILASGRQARYMGFSDNEPSLRVCRAVGYRKSHDLRFYRGRKR